MPHSLNGKYITVNHNTGESRRPGFAFLFCLTFYFGPKVTEPPPYNSAGALNGTLSEFVPVLEQLETTGAVTDGGDGVGRNAHTIQHGQEQVGHRGAILVDHVTTALDSHCGAARQ